MRTTTASRNARSCDRDQQALRARGKLILEPLDRRHVQVVRRLVEQQQVELGDEEPGQRGARLLAARHLASAAASSRPLRNPRPDSVGVNADVERVAAAGIELVVQLRVLRRRDARFTRCL